MYKDPSNSINQLNNFTQANTSTFYTQAKHSAAPCPTYDNLEKRVAVLEELMSEQIPLQQRLHLLQKRVALLEKYVNPESCLIDTVTQIETQDDKVAATKQSHFTGEVDAVKLDQRITQLKTNIDQTIANYLAMSDKIEKLVERTEALGINANQEHIEPSHVVTKPDAEKYSSDNEIQLSRHLKK